MLRLFSNEYTHMKFCKLVNRSLIAASSFLIMLTLLAGAVPGCGIPSIPYLYPPEALGGGEVGFNHDKNNDPDVFRGYEFFYRFYAGNPDEAGIRQAEIDMQNYFNGAGAIRSIVYGTSSSAFAYGFRRLILEGKSIADPAPLLPIDIADRNSTFRIDLINDYQNDKINYTYESNSYEVFRYVPYNEDGYVYKPFLPVPDTDTDTELYDFAAGEEDIYETVSDEIDGGKTLYVAFFAVPYGFDDEAVQELYANGSYEGMEYIGSFELQ